MISDQFTISVASGGTTSTAFQIGLGFRYVGLLFPAMDDGDIGLAISLDSGANYSPGFSKRGTYRKRCKIMSDEPDHINVTPENLALHIQYMRKDLREICLNWIQNM
jgi:hypothetical protein